MENLITTFVVLLLGASQKVNRWRLLNSPETLYLSVLIREGMSIVTGAPCTLRTRLQNGRKQSHHKDLLVANQQVDLRKMLGDEHRSNSPYL
jgi:hypothetical protein